MRFKTAHLGEWTNTMFAGFLYHLHAPAERRDAADTVPVQKTERAHETKSEVARLTEIYEAKLKEGERALEEMKETVRVRDEKVKELEEQLRLREEELSALARSVLYPVPRLRFAYALDGEEIGLAVG